MQHLQEGPYEQLTKMPLSSQFLFFFSKLIDAFLSSTIAGVRIKPSIRQLETYLHIMLSTTLIHAHLT